MVMIVIVIVEPLVAPAEREGQKADSCDLFQGT